MQTLILALLLTVPLPYRSQVNPTTLSDAVESVAEAHGVRPTLLLSVLWVESRLDPEAVSRTDDWGISQLNPGSYWYRSVRGICAAVPDACLLAQVNAAGALLAVERRRCRGMRGALTAYHWGTCSGDEAYARKVLGVFRRLERLRE